MRRKALIPALMLICATVAACSGGKAPTTPTTAAPVRIASTAKLAIVSPTQGAVVKGSDVAVTVSLKDAKIVQPTSTHIVPNEGHLHILIDGSLRIMSGTLTTVIPGVKPGHHVLEAEFVENSHVPFDPPVVAVVSIDVQG